ncbi:Crp/Fnr family transcriptional regulator [Denitromonas iodatirespirans]|uniref:Crp/Fnr family transcriptional regulator n=1 Tax=Denitromonas iodatirespirans TaxID=2795389 RepID=A0A944D815_DENI1|nr:Crp/Fnr family transcriptional regulator [Denitromonas iodatirespirans]MBT0960282.1 Crp/Fnr family transcriptional regulator [Denitromonas iodatirespirans]
MPHSNWTQRFALFDGADALVCRRIEASALLLRLPVNATLCSPERAFDGALFIEHGALMGGVVGPGGTCVGGAVYSPGEAFVPLTIVECVKELRTMKVAAPLVGHHVSSDALATLLATAPELHARLRAQTARDINGILASVSNFRRTAVARLAAFLVRITPEPEEAAGCIDDFPCAVRLPGSRRLIAWHLGLSGETVSRAFRQLQNDGAVSPFKRSVVLVKPCRLRAAASGT